MSRTAAVAAATPRIGTAPVCWIGPTQHPESRIAWGWLKRHFPTTTRESLQDLAGYPIASLRHAVVFRNRRTMLDQTAWQAAVGKHPLAQWAALNSCLCEGESRTGQPWPGFHQLATREATDNLENWITGNGGRRLDCGGDGSRLRVGLVAAQYRDSDALRDFVNSLGGFALWVRPSELSRLIGIRRIFVDDSAVDRVVKSGMIASWRRKGVEFALLASIARAEDCDHWHAAGFGRVFPKPFSLDSIHAWIAEAAN